MPLNDEWITGSGLLENENITIASSVFAFDSDYNHGKTCCAVWTVTCLSDGRTEKVLLPLGDGWEPTEGGTRVKREDGNERTIAKASAYGQFLESVKVLPDAVAALENLPFGPKSAALWIGLSFHVIRKEETFNIPARGSEPAAVRSVSRLEADAFLGSAGQLAGTASPAAVAASAPAAPVAPVAAPAVGVVAPPVAPVAPPAGVVGAVGPAVGAVGVTPVASPGVPMPAAAPAPAAAPVAPPAAAAPASAWGNLNQDQLNQLAGIAKASADHGAFMLGAFAMPGVQGDAAAETGVMDTTANGWYAQLKG